MTPKIVNKLYGFMKVMARADKINPNKYAPESPMKILAVGRLKIKNDTIETDTIRETLKIELMPNIKLKIENPKRDIKTKLPANPSMPS